jgi:MFS family permease
VGGVPALLIGFIRYGVRESARWEALAVRRWSLGDIFSPLYMRRTAVNSLLVFISIIGLWAGSVYVPASIAQIATREGLTATAHLASYGTMILAAGTILGCIALPPIAEALGRRATLGIYFAVMCASIALGFGYVFYHSTLATFFVILFFLGLGGANFAVYTLWLPEQYTTDCRASAFAFITSVGRFAGAGITFLVGAGVAHYHTIGKPVAFTAIAFVVGILMLPLAVETRGQPLPR